jgi:hypothetical protein
MSQPASTVPAVTDARRLYELEIEPEIRERDHHGPAGQMYERQA